MVYVLDKTGKPLMPTERHGRVRKLLKAGLAKPVQREPFTIQLLYDCEGHTQDITLGVDAGFKHIGLSATTESKELYAGEAICRTDIVNLIAARRELRRGRRNRKTRHRKPRFLNRTSSKKKGWLPPSIVNKIDTHIHAIQRVCDILPITKIRIETAEFDIHKLKNPNVEDIGYQQGEKYGYLNLRNYILWRDGHKCRFCGCKESKFSVISDTEGKGTTVQPSHLFTACQVCTELYSKGLLNLKKRRRRFVAPTQMGIMRDGLLKKAEETFTIPVEQTYGFVTKGIRKDYGIEKTHINDARCISQHPLAKPLDTTFLFTKVRCHNRQIHKFTTSKGGIRKRNQSAYRVKGFGLFDKVTAKGKEWFVNSRRTKGCFDLKNFDGEHLNIVPNKIKLINHQCGFLTGKLACA